MQGISFQNNPYETVYRQVKQPQGDSLSKVEAEELVRHLGLIYNTFGIAMKDFIRIVGHKFKDDSANESKSTLPNINNQIYRTEISKDVQKGVWSEKNEEKDIKIHVNKPSFQRDNPSQQPRRYKQEVVKEENEWDIEGYAYNKEQNQYSQSVNHQSITSELNKNTQILSKEFFDEFAHKGLPQKRQIARRSSPEVSSKLSLNRPNDNKMIIIEEQEDDIPDDSGTKNYNRIQQPRNQLNSVNDNLWMTNNQKEGEYIVRANPGRTKKQRQGYSGIGCHDCERYYKSMGIEGDQICQCSSRHKSNLPLRRYEKKGFTQQLDLD